MEIMKNILKYKLSPKFTLLINPTSGAIDIIPNRILEGIISSNEITRLKGRGYFEHKKETQIRLQGVAESHKQNIPYWFYVLTTLKCNFNCPICYEKTTTKTADLNKEVLSQILEIIKKIVISESIPKDKVYIVLFGGEPLCGRKEVIEKALRRIKENGWKAILVTNGSRIKEFLELLNSYKETIADFRITLDGPAEIHNARRPLRNKQGSFDAVVSAIDLLLANNFTIKMQTILGSGNLEHIEKVAKLVLRKGWHEKDNFQWRIEGSHDYANLDPEKDEISEGKMVKAIVNVMNKYPSINNKIKFESFKYLGHITRSFGWMGRYKTYWGPKFNFCEPQKGLHYVFSTNGEIYHCPRTINNNTFLIGDTKKGFNQNLDKFKKRSIVTKKKCRICNLNTLCGGGCVVQKQYFKNFDCKDYVRRVIDEYIDLMSGKILKKAENNKITSINDTWL